MKRVMFTAVMVALLLAPGLAAAQESKAPEMDSAMAAMWAEWAKYADPVAEHKQMERQVGKWTYVSKMWMDPNAPATESKGTCEVTPLLGGRFFRTDYHGDMMGKPFEGIAIAGYDIAKKLYTGVWMDNFGTMMMTYSGTCNADGSECVYKATFDDPVMKVTKSVREVCRWTGPDTWVMEWYESWPGQEERKGMEITHTRVK